MIVMEYRSRYVVGAENLTLTTFVAEYAYMYHTGIVLCRTLHMIKFIYHRRGREVASRMTHIVVVIRFSKK